MTSILNNTSAMNALSALRNVNNNLETSQDRISSGLKVGSAKDNAAYFQISETMKGDSSAYSSINEGLSLTKNSISTARLGAETIQDLSQQFLDKVAFAQGATGGQGEIENDLLELVKQMETTLSQSTFNGDDMLGAGSYGTVDITAPTLDGTDGTFTAPAANADATVGVTRDVVTGITRAGGTYGTTDIEVGTYDMALVVTSFKTLATGFEANAIAGTGADFLAGALATAEGVVDTVNDISTKLGQAEKSIEGQQEFLTSLTDTLDSGVSSMIDADMEEEAARLQAYQVQQQLATQSLSIANQQPQNILSLFQ